jgi:SAM-dependent methyltransferase
MSLLVPPRRFDPAVPEMMDRPAQNPKLLRDDLSVLELINRRFGGHAVVLHYLEQFCRSSLAPTVHRPLSVLDLATGAGDIPRAIVAWAKQRRLPVLVTAVDGNPDILQIARERCAAFPEIHLEQHNLLALPFAPASFDVVLCALTLHHFTEANAVAILRRIRDIARVGFIVNDLRRSRPAIWLSQIMARTIITNPIARFDAPASCERAFTVSELHALATRAGMTKFRVRPHFVYRMALVGAA